MWVYKTRVVWGNARTGGEMPQPCKVSTSGYTLVERQKPAEGDKSKNGEMVHERKSG